ncbi:MULTISPECIES: DUF4886 domain-containing protein [Sphingobacterium]|uniref:DUF4886 domain-containing protein n=1 Tax=Sphingobacterium populi TaxID=1812824 RepID=A0ABW5U7S3_9SPHI|nr:DUF4886 domain-containing protein [Sphingobacterium sp. CFCC 11742]
MNDVNITVYDGASAWEAVQKMAAIKKEIADGLVGDLIDPIAPGTAQVPAVIPAGPAGKKRKFEPRPGFYQGFPEVTSDKRWYFYWDDSIWQLVDLGKIPDSSIQTISYNNSILTTGRFWNTSAGVGGVMPESPSIFGNGTTQDFNAGKVKIFKGDIISLRTRGGANSRGYYITNVSRVVKLLSAANVNTLTNPFNYEVIEDGWLYTTCIQTGYAAFSLSITRNRAEVLDSRLTAVESAMGGDQPSVLFTPPRFRNNPLPTAGQTLRILFISNSYAVDTTRDINRFIDASNIPASNIAVFVAFQSGGSLNDWWSNFQNNSNVSLERRGGTLSIGEESGSINSILSKHWDVIVFQQASLYSTNFATYSNVSKIINHARKYCTNQKVCFAWNSIWSYADSYATKPTGLERLNLTLEASKKVFNEIGIDIIIPTGVAIQNARLVTDPIVDGGNGLTRDGTHLAFGTGTYIAAATFFYAIISPFFNVPLLGSAARRPATAGSGDNANAMAVDESNYMVCQNSAFLAVMDMWSVRNPVILE